MKNIEEEKKECVLIFQLQSSAEILVSFDGVSRLMMCVKVNFSFNSHINNTWTCPGPQQWEEVPVDFSYKTRLSGSPHTLSPALLAAIHAVHFHVHGRETQTQVCRGIFLQLKIEHGLITSCRWRWLVVWVEMAYLCNVNIVAAALTPTNVDEIAVVQHSNKFLAGNYYALPAELYFSVLSTLVVIRIVVTNFCFVHFFPVFIPFFCNSLLLC